MLAEQAKMVNTEAEVVDLTLVCLLPVVPLLLVHLFIEWQSWSVHGDAMAQLLFLHLKFHSRVPLLVVVHVVVGMARTVRSVIRGMATRLLLRRNSSTLREWVAAEFRGRIGLEWFGSCVCSS